MKKILVRLAISMLLIGVLVLVSGTALGVVEQANPGNATANETATVNTTMAVTSNVTGAATYQAQNTAVSETNVDVTSTSVETKVSTPAETTPAETTPAETTSAETEIPTPVPTPTPKSPGFESIIAIATIISVICVFNIRRR